MKKFLLILLALLMLTGCTKNPDPQPQPDPDPKPQPQPDPDPIIDVDPVEELLKEMTLEEKVAQLFVVRLEVLCEDMGQTDRNYYRREGVKALTEEMIQTLEKYQLGGFILFGKNITDPEQLIALNNQLMQYSTITPIITIDEEGGQVGRIAWNDNFPVTRFPLLYDYFENGDTARAYLVGRTIGEYLVEYGFNTVCAPVADIFTNPDNKVIGKRAFGSDAETVSTLVSSVMDGFHSVGIMTTLKHYPGHGDTSSDTHRDTVNVDKNWEELETCELIPFIDNMDETELIMVAHITVKGDDVPASMSYKGITDLLRNKYGYKGLVMTDALDMGAITSHYTVEEAVVNAFLAGNDILLMPDGLSKAYTAMIEAVNNGTVTQERLDESVYRILKYKVEHFLILE